MHLPFSERHAAQGCKACSPKRLRGRTRVLRVLPGEDGRAAPTCVMPPKHATRAARGLLAHAAQSRACGSALRMRLSAVSLARLATRAEMRQAAQAAPARSARECSGSVRPKCDRCRSGLARSVEASRAGPACFPHPGLPMLLLRPRRLIFLRKEVTS